MVTDRFLEEKDIPVLVESLAHDEYHTTTNVDFFTQYGTLSKVYELDGKPVLVCRACKSLRLDIQFLDNLDYANNREVMLEGFPELVTRAKDAGFTEILFCTSSPLLKRFCKQQLGFQEVEGHELRRLL